MGEQLFTTQVPASVGLNDGTDYTLGTLIRFAVAGTVNGIRWFAADQGESGRVGLLFRRDTETTGTELARVAFVTVTDAAWNYTPFGSPVPVVANQWYVAAMYVPRRYTATAGFFAAGGAGAAGLTSGDLFSPPDDDHNGLGGAVGLRNGKFLDGQGAPAYPSSQFGGGCYFVDVDFTPTAAGSQPGTWGVHI